MRNLLVPQRAAVAVVTAFILAIAPIQFGPQKVGAGFASWLSSLTSFERSDAGATVLDYDAEVLADAPTAYYRLDEAAGPTAADSSGNGNDLTYGPYTGYSGAGAIADDAGTSVGYGYDDIAAGTTTGLPNGGMARTVEFWIMPNGSFPEVVTWGDGISNFTVGIGHDLSINVSDGGNVLTFPWAQANDIAVFHHVAVTYSSGEVKAFLDGYLAGTAALSVSTPTDGQLRLGGRSTGLLDEVAVYDSALSPSRILQHFTRGQISSRECATVPTAGYGAIAKGGARAGCETTRMVRVTSWAPAGTEANLAEGVGRWVMLGGSTRWNYLKSGVWGPRNLKLRTSNTPFANSQTDVVPASSLQWPRGEQLKGLFGQRQIK